MAEYVFCPLCDGYCQVNGVDPCPACAGDGCVSPDHAKRIRKDMENSE